MITEKIHESAKKNIAISALKSVIYNELIKKSVYNEKNGKPFSKYTIKIVLRGEKENLRIEKVIIDLLNEMKSKREGVERDYKESLKQEQPHTLH